MKLIAAIAAYLALTGSVSAQMPNNNETMGWRDWNRVGQAQLSMFFFDIYESQLLTPNGQYAVSQDITPHPLALSITYQRDISQRQLLDATAKQWKKLGYESGTLQSWTKQLELIFPDIEEGNQLTYVTDGYRGQFYFSSPLEEETLIGSIDEEAFNDAFLAIWLAPNTEYPDLRARLIGNNR